MASKKIPRLKTEASFARFVEGHDLASQVKEMELVDQTLALAPELVERIRERAKKRLIALRLPEWQIEGARRIAKRKKVPYQALMRACSPGGLLEPSYGRNLRQPLAAIRNGGRPPWPAWRTIGESVILSLSEQSMKSNGRIVQELVNFVREQRKINGEQKGINRNLEKFAREQSEMNRGFKADLQELKAINTGIAKTLAYSEKRFQTFYHLIVALQRRG